MEELNDSYADKVMARDNAPIPVNSLAKENTNQGFAISPARFNFKPTINISTPLPPRPPMPQRQSHASSSLTSMFEQSPPVPQRLSFATGGGSGRPHPHIQPETESRRFYATGPKAQIQLGINTGGKGQYGQKTNA